MNTRFSIAIFLMSMTFYACVNGQTSSSKFKLTTEIGDIRFDESITHFKQAEVISNALGKKYIFSLHGKADLKNENPTTGFYIAPLKFMDYQGAKDYVDKFANGYGKNYGIIKLENVNKKETTINNLKTYIITFSTVNKANEKSFVTLAILSNGKNSIEFSGNDFENGIYSDKFINTIKSFEM